MPSIPITEQPSSCLTTPRPPYCLSHREPHRKKTRRISRFVLTTFTIIHSFLCQGHRAFSVHSTELRALTKWYLISNVWCCLALYQHPVGRGGKISSTHAPPITTTECNPKQPSVACVFLCDFERIHLSYLPNNQPKPLIWIRYIDDIFAIWPHGMDALLELNSWLNSRHPRIQFTCAFLSPLRLFLTPQSNLSMVPYKQNYKSNQLLWVIST